VEGYLMAETPSKRRRQGREAFIPGENPMDWQPYRRGSWGYDYHLRDWLDGWKEAEEVFNKEQEADEPEICPYCGKELS